MYLVKLDLKNFRAIHQMSLDFRDANGAARRWTVLLGENGCGKSSMLKALGLLLAGSEALPDVLGVPDQWIRTGQVEAHLRATITTAAGQERDISLVIRRGDGRDTVIKRNAEGLAPLDDAIRHAKRNYFIAGYGAFRRPPEPLPNLRWTFYDILVDRLDTIHHGNQAKSQKAYDKVIKMCAPSAQFAGMCRYFARQAGVDV